MTVDFVQDHLGADVGQCTMIEVANCTVRPRGKCVMRRSTPVMLIFSLLLATAACATHRVSDIGEWQPLFRSPGAPISALTISGDGALFASAGGAAFRALPGDDTTWTALGELPAGPDTRLVRRLYAPSRAVAYAITYGCARVYRWEEGGAWTVVSTPVSDSVIVDGHAQGCIQLYDIWGRGPNDIYAVGSYATILHFDGQVWTAQRSPLSEFAHGGGDMRARSNLFDVGGAGAATFAVGLYDMLLTDDSGGWRVLFSEPRDGSGCALSVAASHGNDILVAGFDPSCLLRIDSRGSVRERLDLRALRGRTPSGSE